MKLLIPLFFALAQGSCYDYEYYDPTTGSSIPGNACARQAAAGTTATVGATAGAVVGTPVSSQTFGASAAYTPIPAPVTTTTFGVPATAATVSYGITAPAAQVYTSAPIIPSAPISSISTPIYGTSTIGASYTVAAPATVAAQYTVAAPATVAAQYTVAAPYTVPAPYTVAAPVATTVTTVAAPYTVAAPVTVSSPYAVTTAVRAGGQGAVTAVRAGAQNSGNNQQLSAELQYYKDLGERQTAQRRRNSRIVQESAEDLSRATLFNRIIAGPGKTTSFFPLVRLGLQKDVADAYKSEKRIANRNAEDAYRRFQEDPSRLNLLVSKYQDLNADLRDAAYQYNVVNSGTFGQRIANSGLFGGGLFSGIGLTQIITQRNQAEDLEDIQRQMQRVQRQLAIEVQTQARANQNGASAGVQQGSVQQRMMAMSVYGPQRG